MIVRRRIWVLIRERNMTSRARRNTRVDFWGVRNVESPLEFARSIGNCFRLWRAPPSWSVSLRVAVRRGSPYRVISLKTFRWYYLAILLVKRDPTYRILVSRWNPATSEMSEREDNVYKAKLAEQAERYDGKHLFSGKGQPVRLKRNGQNSIKNTRSR